jgi:hypothetical protein
MAALATVIDPMRHGWVNRFDVNLFGVKEVTAHAAGAFKWPADYRSDSVHGFRFQKG